MMQPDHMAVAAPKSFQLCCVARAVCSLLLMLVLLLLMVLLVSDLQHGCSSPVI